MGYKIHAIGNPNLGYGSKVYSNEKKNKSKESHPKLYFKLFCKKSAIHGVRYLAEDNVSYYEKICWALILLSAIYGTIHICLMLSTRYQKSMLKTVLLSSSFPVYIIQYPAVMVCTSNRLNWMRFNEAKKLYLPGNSTKDVEDLFEKFIAKFESLKFGDFKIFGNLRNEPLKKLDGVNINAVIEFMSLECDELFLGECWWRNSFRNCCEIFGKQNSPYGYCFAFNSISNKVGIELEKKSGIGHYPYKSSSANTWSGLRADIFLNKSFKRPGSDIKDGIEVVVLDPDQWTGSATPFIPLQTEAFVKLQPVLFHSMNETRKIHPDVRQCYFPDEGNQQAKSLPGDRHRYSYEDCFAECQRRTTGDLCNCTLEIFHPIGVDFPACKPSDFHCLYDNSKILRFTKNFEEDDYVDNDGAGMKCFCLRFCYSLRLGFDMDYDYIFDDKFSNKITLDVAYHSETMPYYKTDLVMNWLDLLVSFGGIAGLFLGSSLISIAEILYFLTIGLFIYWRKTVKKDNDNKIFISSDKWPNKKHITTIKKY